jgi:vacuolar-type H+-ATPase subunit I/STV1
MYINLTLFSRVYLGFATRRTFRRLVYISIIVIAAVSIFSIFIVAFQCPKEPSFAVSPALLQNRGAGHCFDLSIVFYWQASWSIGSDVVILLLPMPILFSLRMRTIKRLSVIAVFAVSLLIPIASIVRLCALILWANSGLHARYYGGYIIFW